MMVTFFLQMSALSVCSLKKSEETYINITYRPNFGTDEAVGGAASTRINNSRRKLEKRLIAKMKVVIKLTMLSYNTCIECKR